MVNSAGKQKPPLLQLVFLQLIATITVSLGFGWYNDWLAQSIYGAAVGGFVAMGSLLYFNWRSFLHKTEEVSAQRLLADVYQAAIGRFMLIALALALIFRFGSHLDKLTVLLTFTLISLFGVGCTAYIVKADDI